MQVNPYLFLEGRCEEAIAFYRATVGAELVTLMRFKEAPAMDGCTMAPGTEEKVMHACLKIGESTVMLSDGRSTGTPTFTGFGLSMTADTEDEAERLFKALGEGGRVVMPFGKTFFARQFGMVTDQFGVGWMVLFMG